MELRDKSRYGIFKANSNVGEVKVKISIYGFGEMFEVYKDNDMINWVDTSEYEEDSYCEDEEVLCVDDIIIYKPFIRCLKRCRI